MPRPDHFAASDHNCSPQLFLHSQISDAGAGCQSQCTCIQHISFHKNLFSRSKIFFLSANAVACFNRIRNLNLTKLFRCFAHLHSLLSDHAIRSVRNFPSGHNACCLSYSAVWDFSLTGSNHSDDAECDRMFCGSIPCLLASQRIAVHRRLVKPGMSCFCINRFRENSSLTAIHRQAFHRSFPFIADIFPFSQLQDSRLRFLHGNPLLSLCGQRITSPSVLPGDSINCLAMLYHPLRQRIHFLPSEVFGTCIKRRIRHHRSALFRWDAQLLSDCGTVHLNFRIWAIMKAFEKHQIHIFCLADHLLQRSAAVFDPHCSGNRKETGHCRAGLGQFLTVFSFLIPICIMCVMLEYCGSDSSLLKYLKQLHQQCRFSCPGRTCYTKYRDIHFSLPLNLL